MTKEEQLRIYSAYLPYDLQVEFKRNIYPASVEIQTLGIKNLGLVLYPGQPNSFKMKPILYDLSYLTTPIEGGILVINQIADLICPNQGFFLTQNEDAILIDFDDAFCTYTINKNYMLDESYEVMQILIKYHFNVFSIPEGEYINKATLIQ